MPWPYALRPRNATGTVVSFFKKINKISINPAGTLSYSRVGQGSENLSFQKNKLNMFYRINNSAKPMSRVFKGAAQYFPFGSSLAGQHGFT